MSGLSVPGLSVSDLSVHRGDLEICRDVSFDAPAGEITVLLGANGAGKTTLLSGIAGALPAAGKIRLNDHDLAKRSPHHRARHGLAYVEQGRTIFSQLTVRQNLAVANPARDARDRSYALFPRLAEKHDVRAGVLSGGEQQMLVIARALVTKPKLLMIDELSLGLAPRVVQTLLEALVDLAAEGVGVLLVEQFAHLALEVGTTAHVLQHGRIVRSDRCAAMLRDRENLLSPHYFGS